MMQKTALMAALTLLLGGCAASTPRAPFIVEGTESAVTVNWTHSKRGTTGALEAAEAHCQRYNRHAQFVGQVTDLELAYNCVR